MAVRQPNQIKLIERVGVPPPVPLPRVRSPGGLGSTVANVLVAPWHRWLVSEYHTPAGSGTW